MVKRGSRLNHGVLLNTSTLFCLVILTQLVEPRSAQKTLLDVTDRLYVYSTEDETLLD